MADPVMDSSIATHAAATWRARPEAIPQEWRPEPAAPFRLHQDMTGRADPEAGSASDDLHRRLAATAERLRAAERHALSREIGLLRELLSDRDKRIAEKDGVIDDLRRRLAAADAERHAMQRRPTGLSTDRRAGGRMRGAAEALGRLLDAVLAAPIEPPSRPAPQATARPADAHQAARARAERALLEQIARHHQQRARRGDGTA
jgi:hypothetical protein